MRTLLISLILASLLAGCSVGGGGYGLATMAVAYWIVDPRAPNWDVHMDVMENNHYAIQLKTKSFTNGGDGEARLVLRNAAEQLVSQERALGYEIVRYEEGLENEFLGGRRYANAVIRLRLRPNENPTWLDTARR